MIKKRLAYIFSICLLGSVLFGVTPGFSQPELGASAPIFSLNDVFGRPYDLAGTRDRPMIVLYFFDATSKASRTGLQSLDQLSRTYKDAELVVWGITRSPASQVSDFVTKVHLQFPVLIDTGKVSDTYQAQLILPSVYILGPGLKLLDQFQGGGKTTEIMLTRLAARELDQNQPMLAKAISREVENKNPDNIEAKTIMGCAALKEGNYSEAEQTFQKLSHRKGKGEIRGKEGLSAVYAKKGETDKALLLATEVEKIAPNRAYVNVVKGDVLYSQGNKEAAIVEYNKAAKKEEGEPFQKAVAFNQLGRLQANHGHYDSARRLYDQAVEINPYYIEATSNKGVAYEKEGNWAKALEAFKAALAVNKNDTYAEVLAKQSEEMLALKKDAVRGERVDKLVKDLAQRYKSQQSSFSRKKDQWTSRPMILTFVDMQEKGGLAQRDGIPAVLSTYLTGQLNTSGRVQVVERVLLERLLEELNLGSSDLADPKTALKLGKVLAAKLIGTGTIIHMPGKTLLTMRLIDTETSAVAKVFTRKIDAATPLETDLNALDREILKTVITKYPLRGFVIQMAGDRVMVNLGTTQGVVLGTKFEIVQPGKPLKYKGKKLQGPPTVIGEIEVVEAGPDISYATILQMDRGLKKDDKIVEKLEDVVAIGGKNASTE